MIRITPQIICDIIKNGLSLSSSQIWIYNQRREIPEDKKLYVVVGLQTATNWGKIAKTVSITGSTGTTGGTGTTGTTGGTGYTGNTGATGGMQDQISTFMKEIISIDLLSYDNEAQERLGEVIGCFGSTYSQQQQELLGLKIFPIPLTINDVSAIEGATLLNRIAISLQVMRKYDMILNAQYYDTFENVDVSKIDL